MPDATSGTERVMAQRINGSAWLIHVDGVPIPATYYEDTHGKLFTFPSENGVVVHAGLDEDGTWLVSAEGPADEPWNPHLFKDGVIYVSDSSGLCEGDRMALSLFAHTILHARSGGELLIACRQLAEAPVRPLADMFEAQPSGEVADA